MQEGLEQRLPLQPGGIWGAGTGSKHQEMESGRLRKRGEREKGAERAGKRDRQTERDGESLWTAVYERKRPSLAM